MPLFRITVKQNRHSNGEKFEKGMSVEIQSKYTSIYSNGGHEIVDAFEKAYGLDIKKAGGGSVMSFAPYLDVKRLK